jgi:hypothetical protein
MKPKQLQQRFFIKRDAREVFMVRQKLINEGGKKLYAVFLSWHAGDLPYNWLYKRIIRRGDTVVAYYFADGFLNADVGNVKVNYQYVADIITRELRKLTFRHHYDSVHLIGISLGNVALSVVADKFRDFDEATQVCTASSLAKSVWYGDRTIDMRYELAKNEQTVDSLKQAWRDIEPANHAAIFKDKKLNIVLSKTDTAIPARFQTEYVAKARDAGARPKIKTAIFGQHYGAIIEYCLTGKI